MDTFRSVGLWDLPSEWGCFHGNEHLRRLQVNTWSVEELRRRLSSLDPQMEQEMEEIRQRYQAKRQPILDAIDAKKRRQQNI